MNYYRAESNRVYESNSGPHHSGDTPLTDKEGKAAHRLQRIVELRHDLPPGATVYANVTHVSPSGMQRSISLYYVKEGRIVDATYIAGQILGCTFDHTNGGIKVGGEGMDMRFSLVYDLSATLYPDGFGLPMTGTTTPTTKAQAARLLAKGYTSRGRNGDASGWDNDGGYALNMAGL